MIWYDLCPLLWDEIIRSIDLLAQAPDPTSEGISVVINHLHQSDPALGEIMLNATRISAWKFRKVNAGSS